jgi:hypothetical protein
MLTRRLFQSGLLHNHSRLLIIGGGAAGVNAALVAVRLGAQVTLVEKNQALFAAQADCNSRWIDPVEQDWPRAHSYSGRWPDAHLDGFVPLGFNAAVGAQVAIRWMTKVNYARLAYGRRLRVKLSTTVLKLEGSSLGSQRKISTLSKSEESESLDSSEYDCVIIATGVIANENIVAHSQPIGTASHFHGIRFWANDRFTDLDYGLPAGNSDSIYVSGAGDGGLKDYIRLTTGQNSAIDVLKRIFDQSHLGKHLESIISNEVLNIEHSAQHALAWNSGPGQDHPILLQVHREYDTLLNEWKVHFSKEWEHAMLELARITLGRNPGRIKLIHRCSHFSNCFPANRLVALLVARFVQSVDGRNYPIFANVSVDAVQPDTPFSGRYQHLCNKLGCWGPSHLIRILHGVTCEPKPYGDQKKTWHTAGGVVLRHGITGNVQVERHILPHTVFV